MEIKQIIKRYVQGDLDEDENNNVTKAILDSIENTQLKKKWGKIIDNDTSHENYLKVISLRKILVWTVAASILLLLIIFIPNQDNSINIGSEYITQLDVSMDPLVTRKDPKQMDSLRSLAMSHYHQKEYGNALKIYNIIDRRNNCGSMDYLYMSTCSLKIGNFEDALYYSNQGLSMASIKDELLWCKALALLGLNKHNEGKSILVDIIKNQRYKSSDAAKLLQELD